MPSSFEPSIRQLRALEAVARTQSFTAAAQELEVSQPTVSNLIVALEKQTGCRFLNRIGGRIETTELFEKLRPQIKAILALKSEVDLVIEDRKSLRAGSFWVGYSTYQVAMLPIARFIHAYPDITVNARAMASLDLTELLKVGELDVAFVTVEKPVEDFVCQTLNSVRVGVVANRTGPLSEVDQLTWSEVEKLRLIQREPNAGTRRIFEAAAQQSCAQPNTILGLGSWGSITSLIRSGIGEGIGLESELMATDQDLKFIPISDENLKAHQCLIAMPPMVDAVCVREMFEISAEIYGT
ncbi:LysR family transcriptional regulator [Shimia sp. R10_1]|uniref:LysR substrate-binding domain-containing protein n=1 Tax=Shimia sp. R10_1 TaxID=2821095 RepID=UPI001AD99FC4|nr:LysR substrate-binding domain-containing protein [Shimia sp. R10_1]MBO9475829.1 LysR family transcriptional regulator [Shimia sp. R10_1]